MMDVPPANRILVAGILGTTLDRAATGQQRRMHDEARALIQRQHDAYLATNLAAADGRAKGPPDRSSPVAQRALTQAIARGELAPLPPRQQIRVEAPTVQTRTGLGGQVTELVLHVATPYGDVFPLSLHVGVAVTGIELLKDAQSVGHGFVVEGAVMFVAGYDRRYADPTNPDDRGQRTRTLRINVRSVRPATPAELETSSAVWLTGTVMQPPRFFRHPDYPTELLAETKLEIRTERATSAFGGHAAAVATTEVPITVPVSHEHAAWTYNAGNVLRIEGLLDGRMARQGGDRAQQAIATLDAAWITGAPARATLKPNDQRRALATYRYERQQLRVQLRLSVLVSHVEPVTGSPITMQEAEERLEAFVAARKTAQQDADAKREERQAAARTSNAPERSAAATAILEVLGENPTELPVPRRRRSGEPRPALPDAGNAATPQGESDADTAAGGVTEVELGGEY